MAIEEKRGCGYRKVGGLYLRGSGDGVPCDRLPLPLTVCPCCSAGIKQTRGWTWIDVPLFVGKAHENCIDDNPCVLCTNTEIIGRAGLLWIGTQFYKTTGEFMSESARLGISRRITAVPKGFEIGKTWVLLAHPKACSCERCHGAGIIVEESIPAISMGPDASIATKHEPCSDCKASGRAAGVFRVFRPNAIEKIVTETQSKDEAEMKKLTDRGITPVIVPDDDPDHQGTVYDKDEEPEPDASV
jgi:hypothetical protein